MKLDVIYFRDNSITVATRRLSEWLYARPQLKVISIQATATGVNNCEVTAWYYVPDGKPPVMFEVWQAARAIDKAESKEQELQNRVRDLEEVLKALEIQRLNVEIEVLDVAYGESIGDMIKERRARLVELTKGE